MNKKGSLGFALVMVLLILFLVAIAIGTYQEHKDFKSFCENNGFENYERGAWRGMNHVCIKVEDGYRVEKKFDNCGRKLCFIRDDALLGSGVK